MDFLRDFDDCVEVGKVISGPLITWTVIITIPAVRVPRTARPKPISWFPGYWSHASGRMLLAFCSHCVTLWLQGFLCSPRFSRYFEVFRRFSRILDLEKLRKTSKNLENLQKPPKTSKTSKNLQKPLKTSQNLPKPSQNLQKLSICQCGTKTK